MWFLLGWVTVVLASCVFAWGSGRPWRGKEAAGDIRYTLRLAKGSVVGFEAGAPTAARVEFEVKPEGRIDRAAKSIGLSVEGQAGHDRFDRALYLMADDPQVVALLRKDRDLADALLALFADPPAGVKATLRVTCRGGQLRVRASCRTNRNEAKAIVERMAPALLAAAHALDAVSTGSARPDPLRWRITALTSLVSGLTLSGTVHAFRVGLSTLPNTIDDVALGLLAMPVALVAMALLVGATGALLGRTSRAHQVLLLVLLLGGPAAYAMAVVEVRDFNIEADTTPAHVYATSVVSSNVHHGGKGSSTYSVTLAGWPGHEDELRMEVRYAVYLRFFDGDPVTVRVHEGALGLAWLESFEPRLDRAVARRPGIISP